MDKKTCFTRVVCRFSNSGTEGPTKEEAKVTSSKIHDSFIMNLPSLVLGTESSPSLIFESIKDAVDSALNGYDGCCLLLGMRGAEETHRFLGQAFATIVKAIKQNSSGENDEWCSDYDALTSEDRGGLVFETGKWLLEQLHNNALTVHESSELGVTYLEISHGEMRDALGGDALCELEQPPGCTNGPSTIRFRGASEWLIDSMDSLARIFIASAHRCGQSESQPELDHRVEENIRRAPPHRIVIFTIERKDRGTNELQRGRLVFLDLSSHTRDTDALCASDGSSPEEANDIRLSRNAIFTLLESLLPGTLSSLRGDGAPTPLMADGDCGILRTVLKETFLNESWRTAVIGTVPVSDVSSPEADHLIRLLKTMEAIPNKPSQYDLATQLDEEVTGLKNRIERLRLTLDLPAVASSRITECHLDNLESLRRELKILRVALQKRGWPPFVPFPLVHARPLLQNPGKDAFIKMPCEGLTPQLISLVQRRGMLKIVGDSLLEPFTLVLLSKAVKTCANNASCRLPFLGRCCVCTLPLPCGETSHHYQNEMILSGQYEPSTLEAQNVQGGSSAAAYYTRSLEANLTSALSEFGLSLLPPSRAACLDASPLGVASEREGGATCSPCSRPATARLIGGSPRDQQSEPPPIQILLPQKDPKRRSAAAQIGRGKAVAEGGIQGNSDFGEYRPPQATLPSPTVKKNTSSTLPSGFSIANKQPGFKRSYQEALLEPLQLRSPQGLSGFPRNQPAGDLVQSPFTAAALSDGGARDQAAYLCDMLFAGCLPERYRRDREVAMESVESKRKSKEIEAAQVAKMLAIEEYRERRLDAKLKELEEKKQREIENQNYLKEKERKRELRSKFLRKQLEDYYGKKETAKIKKSGAGSRTIGKGVPMGLGKGNTERNSESQRKNEQVERNKAERCRHMGDFLIDTSSVGDVYTQRDQTDACLVLCATCKQNRILEAPVQTEAILPNLHQGQKADDTRVGGDGRDDCGPTPTVPVLPDLVSTASRAAPELEG